MHERATGTHRPKLKVEPLSNDLLAQLSHFTNKVLVEVRDGTREIASGPRWHVYPKRLHLLAPFMRALLMEGAARCGMQHGP